MRILFLTNRPYLPQKVGGAESSTDAMIKALEARGNSCMVLAALLPGLNWLSLKNKIRRKVTGHSAAIDRAAGYPVARGWDLTSAIKETKERFSPDVAILLPSTGGFRKLADSLYDAGIPVVLHLRDVDFQALGDPRNASLAGVISNSRFTSNLFKKEFGLESKVIYNIFNRDSYKTTAQDQYVTFINPVEVKGRKIALELARNNPDIKFLFVEGWRLNEEDKQELLKITKQLGNVIWLDRLHDMRKVYSKTRILLVPSQLEEAWGRVVSEAHVSGIPVLASDIGGLPESVGPGGKLINPKEIDDWQQALRELWDDAGVWQSFSKAAYNFSLRTELDVDDIVKQYESALKSFIEHPE